MVIGWFSCGATSAVACKMALAMYNNVEIYYIDTGTGHQDNIRFLKECEDWFGVPIHILKSDKYKNVADVLREKRYVNGPTGAACTFELKKKVRYDLQKHIGSWEGQVWGFDYCAREINRAIRFRQQNPATKPLFPLIERQITKEDAMGMLQKAHIEIPMMYKLGYNNNNCIGYVKGGIGYWNKIRKDFPIAFNQMAKIEREVGATCLKDSNGRIYLDELDPNRGAEIQEIVPDCSLFCQIEFQNFEDKQTKKVLNGEISINQTV